MVGEIGMLKAIMFDLDGTLVDTMPAFADLAAEVMATHFGDDRVEARRLYLKTSGIPFIHQLGVIHPDDSRNRSASDEFEHRKQEICARTPMDPETVEALWRIRNRGLKLIVSSNTGQSFVDDFIKREQFPFDLALGFDPDVGLSKGKPHVDHALKVLGLAPEQLLFVGDSLKDGEIAASSGIRFVGRLGTFAEVQFRECFPDGEVIRRIDDLLTKV